jgi:hypothetical protein
MEDREALALGDARREAEAAAPVGHPVADQVCQPARLAIPVESGFWT